MKKKPTFPRDRMVQAGNVVFLTNAFAHVAFGDPWRDPEQLKILEAHIQHACDPNRPRKRSAAGAAFLAQWQQRQHGAPVVTV